jgi:hypothetical protein
MSSSRLGVMTGSAIEEPKTGKNAPRHQQDRSFNPNRSHWLSRLRGRSRLVDGKAGGEELVGRAALKTGIAVTRLFIGRRK